MHDMLLTKVEFLSNEQVIFTYTCPDCSMVIEIDTQEEEVRVTQQGGQEGVGHRGESLLNLRVEFSEPVYNVKDREIINNLLADVNLN